MARDVAQYSVCLACIDPGFNPQCVWGGGGKRKRGMEEVKTGNGEENKRLE